MKAGLVGLGVMGRNLALNLRDAGHELVVTDAWASAREWSAPAIGVVAGLEQLVEALAEPRVILLMVKAGAPVDAAIAALQPLLSPGDIIIDGGNSLFSDTERRAASLAAQGLGFVGCGISGGAEGARRGAAIMVGASEADWSEVEPLLRSAAALAKADGRATLEYFGRGGAGHFVKMVHNGIEYAIMQAIAEAHALMREGLGLEPEAIRACLQEWATKGSGAGFLLEISAEIAATLDPDSGDPLLTKIEDVAGQKGTGGWTVKAAIDHGVAVPAIMEAVAARQVSGERAARAVMREALAERSTLAAEEELQADIKAALNGAMIVALSQGLELYATAARERGWRAALGPVLRVWRAGSILRMRMLDPLAAQLDAQPDARSCLEIPAIASVLARELPAWRRVVVSAIGAGLPVPVLSSALGYVDALGSERLPTAMIQAQRDRFGAHGFRRTDRNGDHHGPWQTPPDVER